MSGWLKRKLHQWASQRSIELRRVPLPLLKRPGLRLGIDLDFVLSHYTRNHANISFIQIGAYDGDAGDALKPFIGDNWRGILVEPQPSPFRRLQERYASEPRLVLANVAVGERDEMREFYTVDSKGDALPPWAEQLGSFRREVIVKHKRFIPDIERRIQVLQVECLTISTLLSRHGFASVDLLQIDTEGYDGVIVRNINYAHISPPIIRYEHKHLSRDERARTIEVLADHGYRIAMEYEDTIAYRIP